MKKGSIFLIFFYSSILYPKPDTSLILNEIMFYPFSGNNEFIEIYNMSQTETIDLNYYKIKVESSSADIITDAGYGTILLPHSYAVILEGDYEITSGIYKNIIPQDALMLKISDNAFGSSGMSNSSDRAVRLINSNNDTVDSHIYRADNNPAFSEEKIIGNRDSSGSSWGNSLKQNGTPGFKNSITPSDFDLMISSVSVAPSLVLVNQDASLRFTIKNNGRNNAEYFEAEVFLDADKDSSGTGEEKFYSRNFSNLSTGDSVETSINIAFQQPGKLNIICRVYYSGDEDFSNNSYLKEVYVYTSGAGCNDIVINEIMYSPPAGEPEWVELFNRTDSSINIRNWSARDNSNLTLFTEDISINPHSYLILSKDSTILNFYSVQSPLVLINLPALNNSGDAFVLKDSIGFLIDSIQYSPEWGGNSGKSLERVDPDSSSAVSDNWKSCASKNRATPGYINSVTKKEYDLELKEIIFNPAAPVYGDNVAISAKVKNHGRSDAVFSLKLSGDKNSDSIPDVQLEQINGFMLAASDSIIVGFNFLSENLRKKTNYHILIEVSGDQDTSNNYLIRTISPGYPVSAVLINEIMYSPSNREPEWIEIFNTTADSVNIRKWSISDIFTVPSSSEITENIYLPGKAFFIISKDSSIKNYHRIIPSGYMIMNFPNLNNDADGIVLKDDRGITIDSAVYQSSQGISGYSLERISVDAPSTLEANWIPSADLEMSTPGRINTATPKLHDLLILDIFYNPQFPVPGEDVYLKGTIKNNGSLDAHNFKIKFFIDADSDGYPEYESGTVVIPQLNSGDSITVASPAALVNLKNKVLSAIKIEFDPDEDTSNNYAERNVEPGFRKNSVLINEIMFNPEENEPEWVEIINVSEDTLNLVNWSISDILTTPAKGFISGKDLFIPPAEFLIITKDSSFHSIHPETKCKVTYVKFGELGNSTDGILLHDFRNAVIDSVLYKSSWGNVKGFSIERISLESPSADINNWTVSLDEKKSTPCFPNSVLTLTVHERNSLSINEIMYDPDIDNCEFVEFYNQSGDEINIGGWKIEDEKGNFKKLSETNFIIEPNSYFTLFSDSLGIEKYKLYDNRSIRIINSGELGLTNAGELILLKDAKGKIIDSLWYSEKWHNKNFIVTKNRSLERINPHLNSNDKNNWSSSADLSGATPGRINSIFTDNLINTESKISVSPNPFSPDNDGFEDFTIINCRLSRPTSQIRMKIFDSRGRLIRTLINNHTAGSDLSVVFNGLEDRGSPMRMGIYIVLVEALDEKTGVMESLKTTVVVARKLN